MKKMKHFIHQTPEEHLAANTASTVHETASVARNTKETTEAVYQLGRFVKDKSVEISGFTGLLRAAKKTNENLDALKDETPKLTKKMEEVKSAAVISNKILKEIRDKKDPEQQEFPEFPTEMNVSLRGVSLVTIKGDKGDAPTKSEITELIKPLVPKPIKGDDGHTPTDAEIARLIKPLVPAPLKGNDGHTPTKSEITELIKPLIPAPVKGDDGSPDTADEVVEKVNTASKKIDAKQIKGLPAALKFVDDYGKNPIGAAGGGREIKYRQNGTLISQHVTDINFSTNLTATYGGDGQINVVASGGGGVTFSIPTGTVDGVNTTFTAPATPRYIVVDGATYFENNGYTLAGLVITTVVPPTGFIYVFV